MKDNTPDDTPWADAPIQYIDIPVCQHCGATKFIKIRTEAAGDGSFSRKLICRTCSRKTLAVFELPEIDLPETGKTAIPDGYL